MKNDKMKNEIKIVAVKICGRSEFLLLEEFRY